MGLGGRINARYSYAGHEIRKIHKSHEALQVLLGGGMLEIVDLESDRILSRLRGAREASIPSEADLYLDRLINALYEVAVAFDETITWPAARTRDDGIHIQILQEIVRTGQVSIPAEDITVTLEPTPGINIEDELRKRPTLCFSQSEPPEFATVFGEDVRRRSVRRDHPDARIRNQCARWQT